MTGITLSSVLLSLCWGHSICYYSMFCSVYHPVCSIVHKLLYMNCVGKYRIHKWKMSRWKSGYFLLPESRHYVPQSFKSLATTGKTVHHFVYFSSCRTVSNASTLICWWWQTCIRADKPWKAHIQIRRGGRFTRLYVYTCPPSARTWRLCSFCCCCWVPCHTVCIILKFIVN